MQSLPSGASQHKPVRLRRGHPASPSATKALISSPDAMSCSEPIEASGLASIAALCSLAVGPSRWSAVLVWAYGSPSLLHSDRVEQHPDAGHE
jgi:hypothetical protein